MSKNIIAQALLEIADGIEQGSFAKRPKIGLTILGSEHGVENMLEAAKLAQSPLYDIVLIGPKVKTDLELVEASDEEQAHKKMEQLQSLFCHLTSLVLKVTTTKNQNNKKEY